MHVYKITEKNGTTYVRIMESLRQNDKVTQKTSRYIPNN